MPVPPRRFGDEELGKKDDDHRANGRSRIPPGTDIPGLFRMRRTRMIQWFIGLVLLYLFFKNIPRRQIPVRAALPSGTAIEGSEAWPSPQVNYPKKQPETPSQKPKEEAGDASQRTYEGPIKFPKLGVTLQAVAQLEGQKATNKNVLFAAASLKSVSTMLPMACEMVRWRRNHVHFVLLGRNMIDWEDLMDINGISPECRLFLHDSRPNFAPISSDLRMEVMVSASLGLIHTFMHPQACIIDGSGSEEDFLVNGIRIKATDIGQSVIELPSNAADLMMWITRLDSGSLRAWNTAQIDIVVQAPAQASGSLLRLLTSLQAAKYFTSTPPRLTIELPAKIPRPLRDYLATFHWPPKDSQPAPDHPVDLLTVRHRLSSRILNPIEASVRFLESFYPSRPQDSHVVVLSPQVELGPLWFHYVKYAVLEYKYAYYKTPDSNSLLGVALTIPSFNLNHSAPFTAPTVELDSGISMEDETSATHFLYQAPSSNAALYFGDKWKEFHSFLTYRLNAENVIDRPKQTASTEPAWLDYLLELTLARGYSMLYPAWTSKSGIATVHNELFQGPEEYASNREQINPEHDPQEPSLNESPSLLSFLPSDGDLPALNGIPYLAQNEDLLDTAAKRTQATDKYFQAFRREVGMCQKASTDVPMEEHGAKDLFCAEDQEEPEEEANAELPSIIRPATWDPQSSTEAFTAKSAIADSKGLLGDLPDFASSVSADSSTLPTVAAARLEPET